MLAEAEAESEKFLVVAPPFIIVSFIVHSHFVAKQNTRKNFMLMSEIDCVLNLIEVTHNCGYVNFFVLRPAVSLINTMVIKRVFKRLLIKKCSVFIGAKICSEHAKEMVKLYWMSSDILVI